MAPLNVLDVSLSLGIFWGFTVFMLGVISGLWHKGEKTVKLFGKVYVGFHPTPVGSLMGALWGFIDGCISGMIIAWIINLFLV